MGRKPPGTALPTTLARRLNSAAGRHKSPPPGGPAYLRVPATLAGFSVDRGPAKPHAPSRWAEPILPRPVQGGPRSSGGRAFTFVSEPHFPGAAYVDSHSAGLPFRL